MQFILLAGFALTAAISFFCRLRVGMLEGAVQRGAKSAEDALAARSRYQRFAKLYAVIAAVCLMLCVGIGMVIQFTGT